MLSVPGDFRKSPGTEIIFYIILQRSQEERGAKTRKKQNQDETRNTRRRRKPASLYGNKNKTENEWNQVKPFRRQERWRKERVRITMAILANQLLRARRRNQGKHFSLVTTCLVLSRHYCVTRLIIKKIKTETEGVRHTEQWEKRKEKTCIRHTDVLERWTKVVKKRNSVSVHQSIDEKLVDH